MRRHLTLLILLSALTFFVGLGWPALTDSDEAYYAEAGREMIETGDWLTPYFNYEPRFQKPILFYWLVSASYLVFGVGAGAARLPSALAGLALVLLTYAAGRRLYGAGPALLAGAIVATSFGYFMVARLALPDLPLALFVNLAIWAAIRWLDTAPDSRPTRWALLAGAAAGVAVLLKGPVGIALPLLVVATIALGRWWRGDLPVARLAAQLTPRAVAGAAAACVIVAAPWYVAMVGAHGADYLRYFLVEENLARFATDRFNPPRPVWFYLPIVLGGLLPWSPLLVLAWPPLKRRVTERQWPSPTTVALLLWAIVPVLFYSVSVGKQPRYILPVMTPLALLLAQLVVTRHRTHAMATDRLVGGAVMTSGCVLVALGALLARARPVFEAAAVPHILTGAAVAAAAGVGLLVVAARLRRRALVAVTLAGVATLLALQLTVWSPARPAPVERMATLLASHHKAGMPSGTFGAFVRNLVYYSGVPQVDLVTDDQAVAFLSAAERVLCVVPERRLRAITARLPTLTRLGTLTYLDTASIRLGTLLRPGTDDAVDTVVLVTNR